MTHDPLSAQLLRQSASHAEVTAALVDLAEQYIDGEPSAWRFWAHEEDEPEDQEAYWGRLVGNVQRLRLYANGLPASTDDIDAVRRVVDEAVFRLVYGIPSIAACVDCLERPVGEIHQLMLGTSFCVLHHIDRMIAAPRSVLVFGGVA